jgi:hypothetical protein
MTRAAEATNPLNVLTVPATKVAKAIERAPLKAQKFTSPKQTAYLAAAEGRARLNLSRNFARRAVR